MSEKSIKLSKHVAKVAEGLEQAHRGQGAASEEIGLVRGFARDRSLGLTLEEVDDLDALLNKTKETNDEALELVKKLKTKIRNRPKQKQEFIKGESGGQANNTAKQRSQSRSRTQTQGTTHSSDETVDPTSHRISKKLCQHYNNGLEGSQLRNEFIQNYSPIRIGVTNVMQRRRDPSIKPAFQTANDGNYYAIAIDGKNCYLVFPRFDLTLQESSYGLGAMGQVFDCPMYSPQLRYRNMKVVKPAHLECDPASQRWRIKEKGTLYLGRGVR